MPKSKNTKVFFIFIQLLSWSKQEKHGEIRLPALGVMKCICLLFPPDLILSCWSHTVNRKLCTFQISSELSSLWTYQIMYWSGNAGVNIGMHMLCKRSQLYNVETFSSYEISFPGFFSFLSQAFSFLSPHLLLFKSRQMVRLCLSCSLFYYMLISIYNRNWPFDKTDWVALEYKQKRPGTGNVKSPPGF